MEIKVGDKVRVSKDAPKMYFFGCNYDNSVCKVILVDRDNAVITQIKNGSFAIPTKYLIKVEDEPTAPTIKVGDVIDTPKGKGTVRISYGDYWVVELDNGVWYIHMETNMPSAPYTEPTEQTEVEEVARIRQLEAELDEFRKAELDRVSHPEKYHTYEVTIDNVAVDWQRYEADLAKEIALKVADEYSDPKEAADYAVSVAKAVVENLKKK